VKPPMPRFIHGDARHLPLPDETVDLVVTSPPYFGLRDYGSDQQIGAEPTPQEFIAALIECTRELTRVLKPAFPMEWPRQLIKGWSPREVCTACGEGRRPVADAGRVPDRPGRVQGRAVDALTGGHGADGRAGSRFTRTATITGYACACPDTTAPTTPGVVLDPFSGTGTTALVAAMLGRHGIGVELNPDYIRLAQWRASDAKERARAAGLDPDAVAAVKTELPGQESLLDLLDGEPA
jgi:SAM-dependent methyltransferase